MLQLDFKGDWRTFVANELANYGFAYEPTCSLEDNTLTYLNIKRRSVPTMVRAVHEAVELKIPSDLVNDYKILRKSIENGDDLTGYLSATINDRDYPDKLLNDWGLLHLHFKRRPERTRYVLFIRFTERDAYIVQAAPHGSSSPHAWVDTDLIQIMHDNWPLMMEPARLKRVACESLSEKERTVQRKKCANVVVSVNDGTCYGPLGSGLTSAGTALSDVYERDKTFVKLNYWEALVRANESNFRQGLGIGDGDPFMIKLIIDPRGCWLYEPTQQVRFDLQGSIGIFT